jgi:hypothetical protein
VNKAIGLFIFGCLVVTPLLDASSAAKKNRAGTAECEGGGGTGRKDAVLDGKKVNCLFDTCTYTERCDETIDGKIVVKRCQKTEYDGASARECKPVKGRVINKQKLQGNSSGTIAAPPQIKKPRFPTKVWKFQKAPVANAPTKDKPKKTWPSKTGTINTVPMKQYKMAPMKQKPN